MNRTTTSQSPPAVPTRTWPALWERDWIAAVILCLAVLYAYQQVWHAGFIWDDDAHLTKNACIVGPLGFKEIWTTSAATYYPLVLSNFWVQHALWGLNPLPYHLVTLLMHVASALLLWKLLRHLKVKGAWLGAALWALHPVQVESVAWITELKNTQSCLFYLGSIFFFLRWQGLDGVSPSRSLHPTGPYVVSLVCAVLAILSKSSTVMLPVVLGLCSWWMAGRWRWRNVLNLIPFFVLSVVASAWTIWEQKFHSGAIGASWTQSWGERVVIAGRVFWFYFGKLLWPDRLVFIYPRWEIDATAVLAYGPALAAVVVMGVLWWNRNGRLRPAFFGLSYFAISLFPVLGFFNIYFFRYSFVGDHFQYLASMGPLVLVGSGICILISSLRSSAGRIAICSALLVGCATLTWRQSKMYASAETLWRTTVAQEPDSWMAQNNLGVALMECDRNEEAVGHFQEALKGNPDRGEVLGNLGKTYIRLGRAAESLPYLLEAKECAPNRPDVLSNLGRALYQTGHLDDAVANLEKALDINPNYVPALSFSGAALLQKGRVEEAEGRLRRAVEIEPENKLANLQLADALRQLGRPEEAFLHLHRALGIDPNSPEAEKNLAWVLATDPDARNRDGARAVALAKHANRLNNGRDPVINVTLAAAYAEMGRFPEAIKAVEVAQQMAVDVNNVALAEGFLSYLDLYRSGRPFRDSR